MGDKALAVEVSKTSKCGRLTNTGGRTCTPKGRPSLLTY